MGGSGCCGGIGILSEGVAVGHEVVDGGVREDMVDDRVVEVVDMAETEPCEVVSFGDRFGHESGAVNIVAAQ